MCGITIYPTACLTSIVFFVNFLMEVIMHRVSLALFFVIIVILLTSCITVKAIKPGHQLTSDMGYIALVFANKIEPIVFGAREVYVVLRQIDSGRSYYLPFTAGGELRLIAVKPGSYQIKNFVYMAGVETIKGKDPQQEIPSILYTIPKRGGTILMTAGYPEDYCADLTVNADEIIYIGDYTWENAFFTETPVVINRSFQPDGSIFYKIHSEHPDMPESITFISLATSAGQSESDTQSETGGQ
jgi:hypothetical protein